MRVNAGSLDKRISIVQEVKEQDPDGYWSIKDRVVHACWAGFSRTSGKEIARNDADYQEVIVRFLIRYTSTAISRKMLVLYRGDRYEITYINDYGDSHEFMEIIAKLVTTGG